MKQICKYMQKKVTSEFCVKLCYVVANTTMLHVRNYIVCTMNELQLAQTK